MTPSLFRIEGNMLDEALQQRVGDWQALKWFPFRAFGDAVPLPHCIDLFRRH